MKMLFYISLIIGMILMILIIVLNLTSKKTFSDREKNSPFECGFDPKNNARMPFSLQFFLIAVIFIIFDVELTLLLPLILSLKTTNLLHFTFMASIFIMIILTGLFHEWKEGALEWAS